jgi:cyclophilin family peptidyl-prolyl cis-trans isomerase
MSSRTASLHPAESPRRHGRRNWRVTRALRSVLEPLESRTLMSIVQNMPVAPFVAHTANPAQDTIDLSKNFSDSDVPGTAVELRTSQGTIDLALTDQATPQAVSNFLHYVDSGEYNNTLFSRSVPNFVEQLGGYSLSALSQHIPIQQGVVVPGEFDQALPDQSPQVQLLAIIADDPATIGGTFTLTYQGATTSPLAFNISSGDLQTAIDGLFTQLGNGMTASVNQGSPTNRGTGYEIALNGGDGNFQLLTVDGSGLTGSNVLARCEPAKNVRGTICMALSGSTNDTATSEWFDNLADNSTNLDVQNGGFTVFAKVVSGQNVFDNVAALPVQDLSKIVGNGALTDVPLQNLTKGQTQLRFDNLVTINQAFSFPGADLTTYTVTTDNPNLIRPTVNGTSLSFQYANGRSGTAVMTVTAKAIGGSTLTKTFTVTVPDPTAPAGPVARDDAPKHISNTQVLAIFPYFNDVDNASPLDPTTLTITTPPANGSFSNNGSGGISYLPNPGFQGVDTFQYTIADMAGNVSQPATVTIDVTNPAQVTIGTSGHRALIYTEPDGTLGRLSIANGSSVITFAGANVQTSTVGGVVTVSGADATISDITVTNFGKLTATLSLSASGGADGLASLGSITSSGPMNVIAPGAVINGDVSIPGTPRFIVFATNDCTLNIGAGTVALLSIQTATDTILNSGGTLNLIRSHSWVSATGFDYLLTTNNIGRILNSGDFDESIKITANDSAINLIFASIGGLLRQGTWTINGVLGGLTAAGAGSSWALNTNNLVRFVRFAGNFTGNISCGAIGPVTIGGNMSGASIVTQASASRTFVQVPLVFVRGAMTDSHIVAPGNIGTIVTSSMTGCDIFAGVVSSLAAGAVAAAASDFNPNVHVFLRSVRTGSFTDSVINAEFITSLSLGAITTNNSGTPFGVGTHATAVFTGALDGATPLVLFGRVQLRNAAALTQFMTDHPGDQFADFKIGLV